MIKVTKNVLTEKQKEIIRKWSEGETGDSWEECVKNMEGCPKKLGVTPEEFALRAAAEVNEVDLTIMLFLMKQNLVIQKVDTK